MGEFGNGSIIVAIVVTGVWLTFIIGWSADQITGRLDEIARILRKSTLPPDEY